MMMRRMILVVGGGVMMVIMIMLMPMVVTWPRLHPAYANTQLIYEVLAAVAALLLVSAFRKKIAGEPQVRN